MALLLLIPLALGWLLARRLLDEDDTLVAAVLALPLGVALTLLSVNGLYHHFSLAHSILGTLLFEGIAALALLLVPARPLRRPGISRASGVLLVVACLVIYLYANAQQIANPDDDYWIHTPLQGLMLHGNFPPTNPFFSNIPMNGHYGRNLSIVTVAWLTGGNTFKSQLVMTDLLQVITFLVFFVALWRSTGSQLQALLGAAFIYFGVDVGGRGGLMDTLQNNNPYVYLYLGLLTHLILTVWRERRVPAAVLAGLVLGDYAIVYETHFGLVALALVGVTPILALRQRRPRLVALAALTLLVATPLAVTQGGPITNIVQRRLAGKKAVAVSKLSNGMLNQAQVVKLTFPKKNLFQIRLATGEYQRISYVYSLDTPLHVFFTRCTSQGYRYIWSWAVVRIGFLPLYLMPLSAFVLLRRGHAAGLFLGAFGTIAYLVPAVVNFGPIYESEYFRWEFAAGLGLAGALGLAAGVLYEELCQRSQGVDWTWEDRPGAIVLKLRPKGLGQLGLGCLIVLTTMLSAHFFVKRMAAVDEWGGLLHGAILIPATGPWLESHTVLDFRAIDWRAAHWLERRVTPGQRLLTDFPEENNFSILFESTLTGVCGARCVGHALPTDEEKIGTTPYHMAGPATAFWATRNPFYLRLLRVDWIYLRPHPGLESLAGVKGLRLVHREVGPSGEERLIYRVHLHAVRLDHPTDRRQARLRIDSSHIPRHMRGGVFCQGTVTLQNTSAGALDLDGRMLCIAPYDLDHHRLTPSLEWLAVPLSGRLRPGQTTTLTIPLAPPHQEGRYQLRLGLQSQGRDCLLPGQEPVMAVDFDELIEKLRLVSGAVNGHRAGSLAPVEFELGAPKHFLWGQSVLASVAAFDPIHHRFYRLPGVDLLRVPLKRQAAGAGRRIRLTAPPAVLPSKAGSWRFDLFLSAEQGRVDRILGPTVKVGP